MMQNCLVVLIALGLLAIATAECPNACSAHGRCGAYDMCVCYRNWMSNDCSERICQFGLAHVDTPKGDLDSSSGVLTGPNVNVITNDAMYPEGTTEQFPAMKDSRSTVLTNSAHYYRECSNKGVCDRSSGTCSCFEGYDGSACQRASCPSSANGVCSGHGTCNSIQELAAMDHENIYRLWDEDVTMGCNCDPGYEGADCSLKKCKVGADPLYYDDFQNIRYANYTVQFYTQTDEAEIYGNYSLIFTDVFGEDWQTDPIDIDANCQVLQSRLESLPNDVIPKGSVRCYKSEENLHMTGGPSTASPDGYIGQKSAQTSATGQVNDGVSTGELIYQATNMSIVNKYILAFPGNPGEIKPLKVNRYLDGKRPTLFTDDVLNTFGVHIYANGFHGEEIDYVNDECEGVLVGLASDEVDDTNKKFTHYLTFDSDLEFERLKRCLGDGDGISTNNVEVYEWDYGTFMNPHLIKLIDATQDKFTEYIRSDGSSYKVLASGISTAAGGGSGWEDFPLTKLCNNMGDWQQDNYHANSANPTNVLYYPGMTAPVSYPGGNFNRGTYGWCKAMDPPGFFVIVYFDDCSAGGLTYKLGVDTTEPTTSTSATTTSCGVGKKGFRVMSRPASDYATTTKFHVYTTKGTMQQVSQNSAAYTTSLTEKYSHNIQKAAYTTPPLNPDFVHSFHGNVIHLQNTTTTGGVGAVDCETAPAGSQGQLDCLRKGDKIFLLNLGDRDDTKCQADYTTGNIAGVTISSSAKDSCFYAADDDSFASNPLYPNMYTVEKIGKVPKSGLYSERAGQFMENAHATPAELYNTASSAIESEGYRHQITLNMGVNALYFGRHYGETSLAPASDPDTKATIYKFYPPTLATTGTTGFKYVGPCSNRGICDQETGFCECFDGYTGDNCGAVNSLAM